MHFFPFTFFPSFFLYFFACFCYFVSFFDLPFITILDNSDNKRFDEAERIGGQDDRSVEPTASNTGARVVSISFRPSGFFC
jgi:hypothetical protein